MRHWPHPNFRVVLIASCLFVAGMTLSFAAMSNGFTESPLVLRNTVFIFVQVSAFATWVFIITAWLNGRQTISRE